MSRVRICVIHPPPPPSVVVGAVYGGLLKQTVELTPNLGGGGFRQSYQEMK